MANKQVIVKETRASGGGMSAFFSKLSRGLMLPIAMLPIAGLFLGVGAGFSNVIKQAMDGADKIEVAQATFFFDAISKIGDMIFGNLPTLFCLGVVIAFSEEAGVAVFSGFVGWLVFNATQASFILENGDGTYKILWYLSVPGSVIGSNVGITSMVTSVFGGITVGLIVAFLYNKFHTIELPPVLGFFSGSRFVPIITFLTIPFLGLFFLMIWPIFGMGLDAFGSKLNAMPYGTDAFIFGVVERSLIPFGLHHAFYTPLWYTSAGGQLLNEAGTQLAAGNQSIWFEFQSQGIPFNVLDGFYLQGHAEGWTLSDATTTITGVQGNFWTITGPEGQIFYLTEGVNPGQYMQGKFPFMLMGLPAAGVAMIMAAKKENRQVAMSVIGAAAITSFLTGITEPLEFTFLFLAPVLYYGFHIWMAGLSFMFLDLMGSHIGMTFSGGIFDYILFGVLPDATNLGSNCIWVIPMGIVLAPIYYIVFYTYIIKMDVKTPGRTDDGNVKMVSKADYKSSKAGETGIASAEAKAAPVEGATTIQEAIAAGISEDRAERFVELETKLGGLANLSAIAACITRLRISVVDPSKVDYEGIKGMGAAGIVGEGKNAQQHIFGAEADKFKGELLKLKEYRS